LTPGAAERTCRATAAVARYRRGAAAGGKPGGAVRHQFRPGIGTRQLRSMIARRLDARGRHHRAFTTGTRQSSQPG
jgi:hypothetical protein